MSKIFQNDFEIKFQFFTNYKVMNAFLTKVLKAQFPDIKVYTSAKQIRSFDGYCKLSVVRNPFNRFGSLYIEKCKVHPHKVKNMKAKAFLQNCQAQILEVYSETFHNIGPIVEPGKEFSTISSKYNLLIGNLNILESISFDTFTNIVELLFQKHKKKLDAHFYPQSWIMTVNNRIIVDHIFKLEIIKDSWDSICNLISVELPFIEGLNQTNFEGPEKYNQLYSRELSHKIRRLYHEDFKNFNY